MEKQGKVSTPPQVSTPHMYTFFYTILKHFENDSQWYYFQRNRRQKKSAFFRLARFSNQKESL